MPKHGFSHFVFTRWNLLDSKTTIYNNPAVPDPEAWMEHRIKLFNEYCLPNMMLQKGSFTWLLAFAPGTPKWITDEYATFPHVKIIFEYPRDWLRRQPIKHGEWVISSRIDNDDTVSINYIERVQAQFNERVLLVDIDGVKRDLSTGKYHTVERHSNNSPFISLIEQAGVKGTSISNDPRERELFDDFNHNLRTVYYCSHSKLEWHFPSMKIQEKLYTMNLHSRNVINKLEGNEHEILP